MACTWMPCPGGPLVRAVLFALVLLPMGMGAVGVSAAEGAGGVTCSLQDYQELYGRAVRQDLQADMEKQKLRAESEMKRREKEVQAKLEAASGAAAQRKQRQEVLPGNWQLLSHQAVGACCPEGASRSLASYNFSLEFRVFENEWTAIPLIDAQAIVAGLTVYRAEESAGQSEWFPLKQGHDALTVLRDRDNVKDGEPWQDHVLVVNRSGLFRVDIQAFVHVQSNRNLHGLSLNLLHPLTTTRLRLSRDLQAHLRELSTEPVAFISQSHGDSFTDIEATLPSSQTFTLQWRMQSSTAAPSVTSPQSQSEREAAVPGAEQEVEGPAQAAVIHDSIHSVEDGILQSTHIFKYLLDVDQSLSNVQVHFFGGARVTSVTAHGMQTWRAVPLASNLSAELGTAVHVAFKTSVISREVIVMVTTELEFDARSRLLPVPVAICQGVLRQPGTLAVVKVANVEIYEQKANGASRAGVEDVPEHLRAKVGWPIVLAYKFLSPGHNISLSVVKHEELSTLEAVADSALYKALVLDSQAMHSFLLVLQNTRQQYMEITGIPEEATLWSLKVNSVATRPVRTGQGRLLAPLLVGTTGSASASKTSVHLTWLTSHAPLGDNGSLALHPPGVDLPIAALSAELSFPESYAVNFTGSLRPVERFSQPQPSPVSYQTGEDVVPEAFDFASAPPPRSSSAKGAGVKAKVPRAGRRHLLEQLLVLPPGARLSAAYGPPPDSPPAAGEGWADRLRSAWR